MPTRRGLGTIISGLAVCLAFLAFGEPELLVVGAVVALIPVLAWIGVAVLPTEVTLTRKLQPSVAHAGEQIEVDDIVGNPGRRTVRWARIEDPVGRLGTAHVPVGSIPPGGTTPAAYRVICHRRGRYRIGPAIVHITDPLGLASRSRRATASDDHILVYPAVERLAGLPIVSGRDPAMQASRPEFSHRGGEDFFTLREYRVGDDLRRVHWPSSAKRDELMIRQLETPWQSRALVVLDVRAGAYASDAEFEHAVSGAASIVDHFSKQGFDASVWAGGTRTLPVVRRAAAMEMLATVSRTPTLDLAGMSGMLGREAAGGALVIVTGRPDSDVVGLRSILGRQFGATVILSAGQAHSSVEGGLLRSGALVVHAPPGTPWAGAWQQRMSRTWQHA